MLRYCFNVMNKQSGNGIAYDIIGLALLYPSSSSVSYR